MRSSDIMNNLKLFWIKAEPVVLVGGFSAVVIYAAWSLLTFVGLIFTGK